MSDVSLFEDRYTPLIGTRTAPRDAGTGVRYGVGSPMGFGATFAWNADDSWDGRLAFAMRGGTVWSVALGSAHAAAWGALPRCFDDACRALADDGDAGSVDLAAWLAGTGMPAVPLSVSRRAGMAVVAAGDSPPLDWHVNDTRRTLSMVAAEVMARLRRLPPPA